MDCKFFRESPVRRRGSFRLVVDELYGVKGESVSGDFDFSEDVLRRALLNIYSKDFHPVTDIEVTLFSEIWSQMNKATRKGFRKSKVTDPDDDFRDAVMRNNAVFAAFKVHRMQNDMAKLLLDSDGNLKPFEQWRKEVMPIASHQVGAWLRTEYDTAVVRAHQAADWQQFEREKDVLPNLRWMPSTSITPGADHKRFWGTVRPIDDAFWSEHRPGDRWNCKCGLSSTDDPVTPIPDFDSRDKAQDGLENNPGKDGKLFSDNHPYQKNAYPKADDAVSKLKKRIDEMIKEMPDNLTIDEKMAIARNNLELEKSIGVVKEKNMTYEEANKGKENPNFSQDTSYKVNCQTCVPVHLLRRRGFNIEAAPNKDNSAYKLMDKQGVEWNKNLFVNYDGSDTKFTWARTWALKNGVRKMTEKKISQFFLENMKEDGLYEIYCAWKGGGAHVFCAETQNGKTRLFDPQSGDDNVLRYISSMSGQSVGVLRIDNKLINSKISGLFTKKK